MTERKSSKRLAPITVAEQVAALELAGMLKKADSKAVPDRLGVASRMAFPIAADSAPSGPLPLADEAYALRLAGYQAREIVDHLNHTRLAREGTLTTEAEVESMLLASTAHRRRSLSASVADQFQVELDRLEKLIGFLWAQAEAGNVNAVDRVIKLMARKAAMLGLDSPEIRLTVNASTTDLDYGALSTDDLRQLKDLMARATRTGNKDTKVIDMVPEK